MWAIAGLLLFITGLLFVLQYKPVQTYLAQKAATYLSRELRTTVSLEGLYFKPFSKLVLHKLYVADESGDTLLYAHEMLASMDLWKLRQRQLTIKRLELRDSRFTLKRYANHTNLSFILNYFRRPTKSTGSRQRMVWDVGTLELANISFAYQYTQSTAKTSGINFRDILLTELSGKFTAIDIENHLFNASIDGLTFREKSGFHLRELNALATVDTDNLELRNLYLATNRSHLRDRLRLEYEDFAAFDDFVNDVNIEMDLDQAQVHSADIEFFAPGLAATHFDVMVSGLFTGRIPAINARNVAMRLGDRTALYGNFTIDGLPNISRTVFAMQLERLTTTGNDIESLVPQLSRSVQLELPDPVDHLEEVVYTGTLHGYYYDFVANGTLKTALGTIATNFELDIRDGGRYSGKLSAADFDLGTLLRHPHIGHSGFDLTVNGTGFTLSKLTSELTGNIRFLDFSGYRYTNTHVQAEFANMHVDGLVRLADPNLQLHVEGRVAIDREHPKYTLQAQVDHAHLQHIGLYRKLPVIIQGASVTADLAGSSLNTITGGIDVHDLLVKVDSSLHKVDSLILTAGGSAGHREIRLNSNLATATLDGELDLNTLDSYFKSVAMRYAPALALETGVIGQQAFDFHLELKDIQPLATLFTTKLLLPDGATINGHFSTTDHIATFNMLVPKVSYGAITADRLIVDEWTSDDGLRLFLTADRISVSDSLYVNNVNLANVMANDSLHFNLKLSDLTASNQLDMNGLVRFEPDAPISMQVLPSSLMINREPWHLNEKATLYLNNGRLDVRGVEISNDRQVARVNGLLSADPDDKVSLAFENFNLSNLNPLMLSSGIELRGTLDGLMQVSSAFKQPYATADIAALGVHFNETQIGDVRLEADFDQVSELVNVRLETTRAGNKTLIANGTYNAAAQTDKLAVIAKLNQSELMLFQPLLGKLVSGLSGTVSADLSVSGSILAPEINGTCYLHGAGFTVNYLKTPYRITDQVTLANSTIVLNNLTMTDPKDNRAFVNGTVDMRDPLIPVIDVTIDATDFLVLNTTFRDNPLYYGTAYGTGRFAFNGPTNAINIGIQARTNEQTRFHIPLNAAGTMTDNDFIRFVSHDTLHDQQLRTRLFKGLSMIMDLQVTPEAETSLYTDLGELTGRGEGTLSLRISSLGDFEMFGDYTINAGKFTFTAQDFINKIFDINQGGTIRWTGQPTDATINLVAVYGQRTSLGPLYNAAGRETVEQRVLAHAMMNLNGNLMRPDITFSLNFPNDPYVKDELQSYLSDVNNVNQQALSLIVRRSFVPGSAADLSRELNNTLLSAGTELAFNQLNNIIAQSLNLKFVDLNIRSLNDASASVRLFNDRLIFTGGVTDRSRLNDLNVFSDRIVTDAELLYLIRKDGRLVLRGSNRLNSRNFLPLAISENYVSALGLVYRQEFYSFEEFVRRLTTVRRKREDGD